ncbi:MAG: alpha/beta hydrolase-fold protein [Bacteroidota bacterium]
MSIALSIFYLSKSAFTQAPSTIVLDSIHSRYLQEKRLISIYLPPNFQRNKAYEIIYCTDGQTIIDFYKSDVDSLIAIQKFPELIMVGIHSNEQLIERTDLQYRNYEYVEGFGGKKDKRFEHHYSFFTKEVIAYVEQTYAIAKRRFFYGTSNGAGFGVSVSAGNPSLFDIYICLSMGGGNYKSLKRSKPDSPFFYLGYGKKEPVPFVIASQDFGDYLSKKKYQYQLKVYDGGHDRNDWKKVFLEVIPTFF